MYQLASVDPSQENGLLVGFRLRDQAEEIVLRRRQAKRERGISACAGSSGGKGDDSPRDYLVDALPGRSGGLAIGQSQKIMLEERGM